MENKCYICGGKSDTCTPWGDYVCSNCLAIINNENIRISSLNKKDRIQELENAILEVMNFIIDESKDDIPHFYSYLRIMKNNINICISSGYEDMKELINLLNEDWKSCFNLHGGIPDWFIYRSVYEERLKINKIFRSKIDKIDKLMQFGEK